MNKSEIVLKHDVIMDILKAHLAEKAFVLFGIDPGSTDRIECLNEYELIVPQEGIRFTRKEKTQEQEHEEPQNPRL